MKKSIILALALALPAMAGDEKAQELLDVAAEHEKNDFDAN